MIVKVYNQQETLLLKKIIYQPTCKIKEEYVDGYLALKHVCTHDNDCIHSCKYNRYGDVVAYGQFHDGAVHGEGCCYHFQDHCWYESPHFVHGEPHGLTAVYDRYRHLVFYGEVHGTEFVRETNEYHPYLDAAYRQKQAFEQPYKKIVDYLNC